MTKSRPLIALLVWLVSVSAFCQARISYSLTVSNPGDTVFHMEMTVQGAGEGPLKVHIPAWCPGWYVTTRFQDDILNVSAATPDDRQLQVSHPDEREWDVNGGGGTVVLRYTVKGHEQGLGFFATHLDQEHGFFLPVSTCMYPEGRLREPVALSVHVPDGWAVATVLPKGATNDSYNAIDYDELADSPFELGHFQRVDFDAAGVPMFATFSCDGRMQANVNNQVADYKKIAETESLIFGGLPMKRYFWNIHLCAGGFNGGLEHRAGVTMSVLDSAQLDMRSLAAHEFFHAWNVKRIRPKILGPFDYSGPQRTKNLWFAEGVTSYYADVTLYRAKMISQDDFLEWILGQIQTLDRSSDRTRYTAEDASWHAWEGASEGYGNLSYYNKGYLIGLLLDLSIRTRTEDAKSFDDVMRTMMKTYCPPKPGYDEGGILAAINTVTGMDYTPLYDRLVRSTSELPYAEVFSVAGLSYAGPGAEADAGFRTWLPGHGAYPLVADIEGGGAGSRMGVENGDCVMKVNGVDSRGNPAPLAAVKAGDKFTMDVLRHGKMLTLTGTMSSHGSQTSRLSLGGKLTPLQRRVTSDWLRR